MIFVIMVIGGSFIRDIFIVLFKDFMRFFLGGGKVMDLMIVCYGGVDIEFDIFMMDSEVFL